MSELSHKRARSLIQQKILSPEERSALADHLGRCDDCREYAQAHVYLSRHLYLEPVRTQLAPGRRAAMLQRIETRHRRNAIMNTSRSAIGATLALAVLAVVVGVFIWWQSGNVDIGALGAPFDRSTRELASLDQGELDRRLFQAVNAGNLEEVAQLLEAGADANGRSSFGALSDVPILATAVTAGNAEVVRLLIERGADVNAIDGDGNFILPKAASAGDLEIARLLLDAGADVNATMSSGGSRPKEGASALHHAALGNHKEMVELLIARGADVNAADATYSETPLFAAVGRNNPEIATILLVNGANVDAQTEAGLTALHSAAIQDFLEVATVLIEHGASLDIETQLGGTALDAATTEDMEQLLREAGATN